MLAPLLLLAPAISMATLSQSAEKMVKVPSSFATMIHFWARLLLALHCWTLVPEAAAAPEASSTFLDFAFLMVA